MGVPILLVSERLGHENVETTLQTYGHLYPAQTRETLEQMNEMVGGDLKDPRRAPEGMIQGEEEEKPSDQP